MWTLTPRPGSLSTECQYYIMLLKYRKIVLVRGCQALAEREGGNSERSELLLTLHRLSLRIDVIITNRAMFIRAKVTPMDVLLC